jgi:hypothetical protein
LSAWNRQSSLSGSHRSLVIFRRIYRNSPITQALGRGHHTAGMMELKHDDGGGSYWRASVDRSYPRSTAATVVASTSHGFAFLYINCHSGGLSTSAVLSALEAPSGWLLVGCGLSRMCRGIFDGKGHSPNDRDVVIGSSRAWPWRSSADEQSAKRGDPTEGPRDV